MIDRREKMVVVPQRLKMEYDRTKISQNTQDNFTFFGGLKENLKSSEKL
jgi:hypothetical protein